MVDPKALLTDGASFPAETTTPQLAPILHLHRHQDGYVSFAAGSDDEFHPRVAIRADELNTFFPSFVDDLLKDSYVSMNAGYRLRRQGANGKAHGKPKHDTANLRYLCSCYTDIDYYKSGVDFGTVLGQVVRLRMPGEFRRLLSS